MRKLRSRTTQRRHQKGFKRDPSGPKMRQNTPKMQKWQKTRPSKKPKGGRGYKWMPKKGALELQISLPEWLLINFPSIYNFYKKNPIMAYSQGFSHPECDLATPTDVIKYCKKLGFGARRARLYRKKWWNRENRKKMWQNNEKTQVRKMCGEIKAWNVILKPPSRTLTHLPGGMRRPWGG